MRFLGNCKIIKTWVVRCIITINNAAFFVKTFCWTEVKIVIWSTDALNLTG